MVGVGTPRRASKLVRGAVLSVWLLLWALVPISTFRAIDPSTEDYDRLIREIAPVSEIEFARSYVELIRDGDYQAVVSAADLDLRSKLTREAFEKLRSVMPPAEPLEMKPIGARVHESSGATSRRHVVLSLQCRYPDRWIMAQIISRTEGTERTVQGVSIFRYEKPLNELHRPSLSKMTIGRALVLLLAGVIHLFMLVTALVCVRTVESTKTLLFWMFLTLICVSSGSLDWSEQGFRFEFFRVSPMGVSFTRDSPYSPMLVSLALPCGAIAFWIWRRFRQRRAEDGPGGPLPRESAAR